MKRSWSVIAIPASLWMALGTAQAEFIGLNIGPGYQAPAHNVYSAANAIELVDDLDFESPTQSSMVLILEHPISALPNIRYQGLALESPGGAALDASGSSESAGSEPRASFELSQDDIVLYYQVPSSQVDLDLGVDLKRFAGEVSVAGSAPSRIDVDETIPLLYLSARYDLSNSGFYVGANINANIVDLGLSKSTAKDSTIMLGYDSGTGLGVEGGYKSFSLNLDNVDSLDSSLEYDGVYLNGYYNF